MDSDPAPGTGPDPAGDPVTEETRRRHLLEASTAAYLRAEAKAPDPVAGRMRALRERIRTRRSLDTAWRMMVFTLGVTLLALGIVMLVFPGPGFGVLILGLVVLASEFTWATRVLDPVKGAALRARKSALDPQRRRRGIIIGGAAGVLIAVILISYIVEFGMTLGPALSSFGTAKDWLAGLF
jgi:uncharacterized protein (TIGR02611 family)